jgi:hypothetical protein
MVDFMFTYDKWLHENRKSIGIYNFNANFIQIYNHNEISITNKNNCYKLIFS